MNVIVVYYNDYIVTQYQCLKVVSLNPPHGEVYSIQHYVIKLVSDLSHAGGFHWVVRHPPPIKLPTMIQLKYC